MMCCAVVVWYGMMCCGMVVWLACVQVKHLQSDLTLRTEQLVVSAMKPVGDKDGFFLYDVEVTRIEDELDVIYGERRVC